MRWSGTDRSHSHRDVESAAGRVDWVRHFFLRVGFGFAVLSAFAIVGSGALRLARFDSGYPATVVEAAAPLTFLLAYPLFAAALWRRRATLCVIAGIGITGHLVWFGGMLPVVHDGQPLPKDGIRLKVLTANLYADNARAGSVVTGIVAAQPDVVAFEEFSNVTAPGIVASTLSASYPYRFLSPRNSPDGMALYSRLPLEATDRLVLAGRQVIRATVVTDRGPVTVVVVHTVSPVSARASSAWSAQLRGVESMLETIPGPMIVLGDFNATLGNREFPDLLRSAHLQDVLDATGRGYAMTWPANRFLPPYVRPDHVLAGRGVVPLGGHTVAVPGSDHRGIVAELGLPATP